MNGGKNAEAMVETLLYAVCGAEGILVPETGVLCGKLAEYIPLYTRYTCEVYF